MILEQMRDLGFDHKIGTPTFTTESGLSLDFVGYSRSDVADRIGGGEKLPVMVYADLSRLLSLPRLPAPPSQRSHPIKGD